MKQHFRVNVSAVIRGDSTCFSEITPCDGWSVSHTYKSTLNPSITFTSCITVEARSVAEAALLASEKAGLPGVGLSGHQCTKYVDEEQDVIPDEFIVVEVPRHASPSVYMASETELVAQAYKRVPTFNYSSLTQADAEKLFNDNIPDTAMKIFNDGEKTVCMINDGFTTSYCRTHEAEYPYQVAHAAIERELSSMFLLRDLDEVMEFMATYDGKASCEIIADLERLLSSEVHQNTAELDHAAEEALAEQIEALMYEKANAHIDKDILRQELKGMVSSLGFRLTA